MPLDVVERPVDGFHDHQQVGSRAGSRSGGVQHKVVERLVQLFPVMGDVFYRFLVYREYQEVFRLGLSALQHFVVELGQHLLVIADAVAHSRIGVLGVQHRPQGLVHHVDDIKGACVLVKVHVQLLVFHGSVLAVLVQQLVAVFQGGTCQQQAALFLVVVDVGFHRYDVESPLGFGDIRQKSQQQESQSQSLSHLTSSFLPFPLRRLRAFSTHRSWHSSTSVSLRPSSVSSSGSTSFNRSMMLYL